MSEQEEVIEVVQNTDEVGQMFEEVQDQRRAPRWIAPAWFLFGVIVGAAAFAIYTAATVKPTPVVDTTAMRGAARDGVIEAIATLQAGSGQPAAQQPQAPTVVDQSQFTVRAANQIASAGAKVTIIEFSDFQ